MTVVMNAEIVYRAQCLPVVELIEHRPHMWEIRSLVLGRVKPMTLKIDTCRFLARRSALLV